MPPILKTTPLWIAARQLIEAHAKDFFKRWNKVAKTYEIEEIHDLRVASRRLREALALFEPCFPGKGLSRAARQVKQVTGLLGDLRNTDESILFFSQLAPEERHPSERELGELLELLGSERQSAQKKLEHDLRALKPGPLKSALKSELAAPRLFGNDRTDPFQGLSSFADGALQARALPLSDLLPRALDEADSCAQHRLRIAVKRMRYRLEILEPLFASGFDALHGQLKRYQEILGKLHDLDVFAGMVLERIPEGSGQQNLLRAITVRRSRLHGSFVRMQESHPLDALGARARSHL